MLYMLKQKITHKFDDVPVGSAFAFPKNPETLFIKVPKGTMAFGHRANAAFEYVQAVALYDGHPLMNYIDDNDRVIFVNGKFIEE